MKGQISRLVSKGEYREALVLYNQLHASGIPPNDFTFPFLLKSCGELQSVPQAQQVHTHVIKSGFDADTYTATALIAALMKLRLFEDAFNLFDTIPKPTLPSFNAVISGFSQCGYFTESLHGFRRLATEGLRPNSVTIASAVPACQMAEQGSMLHCLAMKMGHDGDGYVATALVTMYANCAELGLARRVFEQIHEKKVVSYNAMISGFLRNGAYSMALDLFREMITLSGENPNLSTLISLLSVCSELSASLLGKQTHCYCLKHHVSSDVKIGTALVEMYSKCGSLGWAYHVFVKLDNKNLVTWNTMISGLLSRGCLDDAMELFGQLRLEGFRPDMATWNLMISGFSRHGSAVEAVRFFTKMQSEGGEKPCLESITSILQACSSISDLRHGKEIHSHVIRNRADCGDEFFQTTMIHMYMNSGCFLHARRMFDRIGWRSCDPALWNAMISGCGRNGETDSALEIFSKMRELRVEPNSATFLSVLTVCSHTGQVEKGWKIFKMMKDYGINPTAKHMSCMVDLLGRAGKLADAWDLIQENPDTPSASIYSSLLGACGCHCNVELGEVVAERLSELEPTSPTPLVILSNIYAGQGRWNDVERLRMILNDRGLFKTPGFSWVGGKKVACHLNLRDNRDIEHC